MADKIMFNVSIEEARANLDALLARVRAGQRVMITEQGETIAVLSPKPEVARATWLTTQPKSPHSSAELLRKMRDEGY